MTTFIVHAPDRADAPTDRLPRVRDRRVPVPAWLHDESGVRLALATVALILLIGFVAAPFAVVMT